MRASGLSKMRGFIEGFLGLKGLGWLTLGVMACLTGTAPAQPGGPPLFSIRVAPAEKVTLAPTIEFTGSIEPWRSIDLSTQVEGMVESIPIDEGQRLQAGDLVCRLDPEETSILVTRHQALIESASAELQRLKAGFLPEEVEESLKNVEAAKARQTRAKEEWERFRPLVDQGVSTLNEGTQMEAAFYEADAELRAAEARLRLLRRGFRAELILKAHADVDKEKAELTEIQRRLNHHVITAPTDCVVVERLLEPGEWVEKGSAVARMVVLNPLRVRIEVPQTYLTRVRPGQKASLRVDGNDGKTYEAEVQQVVPRSGEATRNFPVLMRLENPDYSLSSGLFARVSLRLEEQREMIAVPREAVLVRGENLVVLVADPIQASDKLSTQSDGTQPVAEIPGPPTPKPDVTIRAVSVRLGNDIDQGVVIEPIEGEAIHPGEEVVVLGGTRLQTGMPARIIRDTAETPPLESATHPGIESE